MGSGAGPEIWIRQTITTTKFLVLLQSYDNVSHQIWDPIIRSIGDQSSNSTFKITMLYHMTVPNPWTGHTHDGDIIMTDTSNYMFDA